MTIRILLCTLLFCCGITFTVMAQKDGSLESSIPNTMDQAKITASRWLAAKFLGEKDSKPIEAQMIVKLKSGLIQKNRRQDRTLLIGGKQFKNGIFMPSPGEIIVSLPEPVVTFEAIVGVDSNDLGYYSNAGRGNVIASVETGDNEIFRSGALHEGMPGVPIKVNLNGAKEFRLKLTGTGQRSRTYQAEWDQADWAEAKITMVDGKIIYLDKLPVGPLPGLFSGELPFSFKYAGKTSQYLSNNWPVERTKRQIDRHRSEYVSIYRDPESKLEIQAIAVAYDDFPVIEWTLFFKNNGDRPTPVVENIQSLDTSFERTKDMEFLLHHSKGSPNSPTDYQPFETSLDPKSEKRFSAKGGRPTDTDLCYFNLEWKSNGLIIALGWPGQWAATFTRDDSTGVRIVAGQELTHFRLMPGEEVRSPLVALMFWEGDWIDAQNNWRRWMVSHNIPRPGGKLPPPQLAGGSGRYTIEMQDANEENQLQYLHRDLDSGVKLDYWWMDAGWYPFKTGWWETGTWELDPARFPKGFLPISAAAHASGVKTMIWFEPERVTPGSWLYINHPEWLLGPDGGNKLLFLGNRQAWQWLVDHVSGLIKEQGIDLYRQDFNFEPLMLWRSNDTEDRQGITEIKHVTGYLAYWDELHRRFPNLPIDTCASGGRRNDLETLRRGVPLWRSDFVYEPSAMQQFTYGIALWIPYFGTAFNSLEPYNFRSQITPATAIGLEPSRQEKGYERLQKNLSDWRKAAGFYYGDYYPLTPYSTSTSEWMAWQFNCPEKGDGMIQAFRRPESTYTSAEYKLRGLENSAQYRVVNLDLTGSKVYSGKILMEQGLPVSIEKKPGAVIIFYTKTTKGQKNH
jgi:alpha-galactosidase